MHKIAIFCGASKGINNIYSEEAVKVGTYFTDHNIDLVYGGGKIGMMGIIADTILEKNGKVIGNLLRHEEVEHIRY